MRKKKYLEVVGSGPKPGKEKEYLEAVFQRGDLESLQAVLTKHLGPAAKEPGTEKTFPREGRGDVPVL